LPLTPDPLASPHLAPGEALLWLADRLARDGRHAAAENVRRLAASVAVRDPRRPPVQPPPRPRWFTYRGEEWREFYGLQLKLLLYLDRRGGVEEAEVVRHLYGGGIRRHTPRYAQARRRLRALAFRLNLKAELCGLPLRVKRPPGGGVLALKAVIVTRRAAAVAPQRRAA
jgi:hypothetical protein